MRGDFSAWNKDRSHNFRGTLHQQGRVLLDRDWNAQTEVMGEWQETAARDAFGAGVAAVPAESSDSFKVVQAANVAAVGMTPAHVEISLKKGRIWADGLLAELSRDVEPPTLPAGVDAIRTATYLGPPIQPAPLADAVPAISDRDAVVLEAWLEELSPFQNPDLLIEPALGGVDTTERVQTAFRLRLYRMAAGDTCESIIDKLKDNFDNKGKLQVELKPTVAIDGDCPVVQGGGYTGFEHRLYRIEIAETDKPASQAYFKWSHLNGGLVGTGDFDAVNKKVTIVGNKNAVIYSGSNTFYLEALDYDVKLGCWKVVYGARVALASDNTLTLPDPAVTPGDIFRGTIPPTPVKGKRFFRLWNGVERVADFTTKKDLPDNLGVQVTFEPEAAGKYTPSDFWTFEMRAGDIGNPLVIIPTLPPQGIFYHRVPLAEVHWTGNTVTGDDIEDCRLLFQPLTKVKTCCTYRVGDGIHSHGDFKKVQDAINALPKSGGEVCVLPGRYDENVVIDPPRNRNVIIKGCGRRTVIRAVSDKPVIHIKYGQGITIESLAVEAHEEGIGILLEGEERAVQDGPAEKDKYLKDIVLSQLFVRAIGNNAIKAYTAQFLTLIDSVIYIKETEKFRTRKPAVYLEGDDMLMERSEIRVLPDRAKSEDEALTNDPNVFISAQAAAGGLQIGGGSERVRVVNNLIVNGIGNGISLGRIDLLKDGKDVPSRDPFDPKGQEEDCCHPDDGLEDDGEENKDGFVAIAGPPLYDILIKGNRIYNMGRNGIGVATYFSMGDNFDPADLKALDNISVRGIISVGKLVIVENRIERCMNIPPQAIPGKMTALMGYGGISLAHTEQLVIRDNVITENGPSFLQPICGIYLLVAEGVEISRNHILNNGVRTKDIPTAGTVKNGPRGGIWITWALSPMIEIGTLLAAVKDVAKIPFASGIPAAKIHDNVVSSPLGRSLTLFAKGPVSVVGNQLTSLGIQPVSFDELIKLFLSEKGLTAGALLQLLALLAGNVLLFDVATATYLPAQQVGFKQVRTGETAKVMANAAGAVADSPATNAAHISATKLQRMMANGTVLFTNNQCHQDLLLPESSFAATSIFIGSLDDVGFHNNQCDCDFQKDLLLVNALVFGITVRLADNDFRERFLNVLWSAATMGLMNITSDNESVHCLLILGGLFLNKHNLVLLEMAGGATGDITAIQEHRCEKFGRMLENFGKASSQATVATPAAEFDPMMGAIK